MKTHQRTAALLCAGLFALSTVASAQFTYNITLSGSQENPPVATSGSGTAMGSLDLDTNLLTWDITFTDLSSGLTGAHFHGPAAIGENAGVLVNLEPPSSGVDAVIGETAGSWSGQAVVSDTIRDHIVNEMTYINLHTSNNLGGELRGQVIPEPGTYALIAGLLALLGAGIWRRRARG